MPRTSLDALIRRVTAYFRKHAGRYGLNPETVEARYILNWGGFVNASFFIQDGEKRYYLKLAEDEDQQADLQRWEAFHQRLTRQYHAPRLLDWIEIPRTPFAGLLFAYIPGKPADFTAQPAVLQGLLDLLPALHSDPVLSTALASLQAGALPTCADYFLDVYIDRFDADLLGIIPNLPPFVDLPTFDWMMSETRHLEGLARDLPIFQHPAASPTHGDLWPSNILVTPAGDWSIIDWDDLALGDPALEYSILLGPQWRSGALTLPAAQALLPPDPDFRDRFAICLRALLLDEVIDSLADWIEAEFLPARREELRAAKEQVHRAALEQYREVYGEEI